MQFFFFFFLKYCHLFMFSLFINLSFTSVFCHFFLCFLFKFLFLVIKESEIKEKNKHKTILVFCYDYCKTFIDGGKKIIYLLQLKKGVWYRCLVEKLRSHINVYQVIHSAISVFNLFIILGDDDNRMKETETELCEKKR